MKRERIGIKYNDLLALFSGESTKNFIHYKEEIASPYIFGVDQYNYNQPFLYKRKYVFVIQRSTGFVYRIPFCWRNMDELFINHHGYGFSV